MTPQQFTDTYLPLSEGLYRLALHLLESGQDAEDAVQDLYARLWKARDSLDGIQNPRAYCLTLLRNMCIDRIRSAQRHGTTALAEETAGQSPGPDEKLHGREKLRGVIQAIERLPESQRKVLMMRVIEEKSYEEIARDTGMSQLTLRVLLSQARKKLKDSQKYL